MDAIIATAHGPGNVKRAVIADPPAPGPGEAVIAIGAVGVCGSDIHVYHGTESYPMRYPVALGHEMMGTIEALGAEVTGFKVGDRVVSETAFRVCGACVNCREGRYNLCPDRIGFGALVNGGMAERVLTRAAILHHVPESVSDVAAALTEPTCVAYQAVVVNTHIQPGDSVAVIGPGPIGLMAIQVLRLLSPCFIAAIGTSADQERLQLARKFGADEVFTDPAYAREELRRAGWGDGVDVVIDAVGLAETVRLALEMVRSGGQITKIGWDPKALNVSLDPLIAKAVRLQGSFSHVWSTWERVLCLMARGRLRPEAMAEVFSFDSWETGFSRMADKRVAKAVLVR